MSLSVASLAAFAAGQKRGTSSSAATISMASRRGSTTPASLSSFDSRLTRAPTVPSTSAISGNAAAASLTELFLDVRNLERFDEGLDLAVQDFGQLVECEIDAMIGDPVLRIIVSANLRRPVTCSDLCFPHARAGCFLLGDARVEEARA